MKKYLLTTCLSLMGCMAQVVNAMADSPLHAPSSGWEVMGTGLYHDELFISWGMPAENWTVTVEQNVDRPGWYRFIPYNENSSVAEVMGYPDDTYMYINATNPKKVYAEEFTVYDTFYFSNVVVENDWDESAQYGRLVDGVISWDPVNTFASYNNGYFYCMGETGVALYLPGSDFKDFAFDIETEHFCNDENYHEIMVKTGADISYVKYLMQAGNHFTQDKLDLVMGNGSTVPVVDGVATVPVDLSMIDDGIVTVMMIGCDDADNAQAWRETNFIVPNLDDRRHVIGETTFYEPFYYGCYDDFRPELLTATIYESNVVPNCYLLEDAYKSHSELFEIPSEGHSHFHGIFVNASDPERVYIEPTCLGVSYDGDGAAWSLAGYYMAAGMTEDEVADKGLFGKRTLNDDGTQTIEMPYGTLMLGEKNYYAGIFIDCDAPFSFVVPATNGVKDLYQSDAFSDDSSTTETEVYNLQGIRVPADTRGAVIIRSGHTVSKRLRSHL